MGLRRTPRTGACSWGPRPVVDHARALLAARTTIGYHSRVTARSLLKLGLPGLLAVASCSDDPVRPPGSTATDTPYEITLEQFAGAIEFISGGDGNEFLTGYWRMLIRSDGDRWLVCELPDSLDNVYGAWLTAGGNLVVHDYYDAYRFDGQTWHDIQLPADRWTMCALPTGEVFVGTWDGRMHRFDGNAWEVDSLPATMLANGVHASAGDDAFAVGDNGAIAHYDGVAWTLVSLDSSLTYRMVWSGGKNRAYVVDDYGNVSEYANGNLTPLSLPPSFRTLLMWGSSQGVHLGGRDDNTWDYAVLRREGSGWSSTRVGGGGIRDGWTSPGGDIFTVAPGGLWRTRGGTSERVLGTDQFGNDGVYAFWWSERDGLFAAGTGAYRFDGTNWIDLRKEEVTERAAVAIHGTDGDNLYAVGGGMILHYDGATWDWMSSGFNSDVYDVWASSEETFAVGSSGMIARLTGDGWVRMDSPSAGTLRGVAGWDGGAVAVGDNGTILRFDGSEWRAEESPVSWRIEDVVAFGPDRMFAVGEGPGILLVRDPGGWSTRPVDTYVPGSYYSIQIRSVWGRSPTDLFVGQSAGQVHHFDGHAWTPLPRVLAGGFSAGVSAPDGDVFVAAGQAVIRYHRPR